jgi:hypothetical protein
LKDNRSGVEGIERTIENIKNDEAKDKKQEDVAL